LDSGACVSLMTESLASSLRLVRLRQTVTLEGCVNERTKSCVVASLQSHNGEHVTPPISFVIVSKLSPAGIPEHKEAILSHPQLRDLHLADPDLGGKVDMLIGNLDLHKCTYDGSLTFDGLRVLNSPFGWSIAGPLHGNAPAQTLIVTATTDSIQDDLSKLWELDKVPDVPTLSREDNQVIQDFVSTHSRVDGRFMVKLPRVKEPPKLGDSRQQAMRRLLSNERSLLAKDKLDAFNSVLREYLQLGHAQVIPRDQLNSQPHFYLPVHGVPPKSVRFSMRLPRPPRDFR